MRKLKVLIVCHFSNASVRSHLPLDNRRLFNIIRRLMGLPAKSGKYSDLASWDTNLIYNLSKRDDVELYVISAHTGLKRSVVKFAIGKVNYWFIRCGVATMLKHVIKSPKLWHSLNPMRPRVRHIARQIHPDVIALIGAENPHISGTILGLEKEYPVIVKTQTIYNNPQRAKVSEFNKINAYVERLIFKRICYFACNNKTHVDLFRQFNPKAYNFIWSFATTYPEVQEQEKEFDFVNFAMAMTAKKGYIDALKALAIIKQDYPLANMNFVGGGTEEEIGTVKNMIRELCLEDSVVITPLFPEQKDMFQHIQKSRFAILPCKLDYVAGTISQAMHYGLPVVCYRTEGTEKLNEGGERVLIAENGDYQDLAQKMVICLRDSDRMDKMKQSAKEYDNLVNDNQAITEQIVAAFNAVVNHYRFGTAIPQKLLYD